MASAEARMLTRLLPSRRAPISRSRSWIRRLTMPARRSPDFSSASMRAREAAVSAVSEPEKKADRTTRRGTASGHQPRAACHVASCSCEEGGHLVGRHVVGDEGLRRCRVTRMKVSAPRLTFLSWAMCLHQRLGDHRLAGDVGDARSAGRRRRDGRRRGRCRRGEHRPRRAEKAKASTMPIATASPCSRRSE